MKPEEVEEQFNHQQIENKLLNYQTVVLKELASKAPKSENKVKFLKQMQSLLLEIEGELLESPFLSIVDNKLTSLDVTIKINTLIILFKILSPATVVSTLKALNYQEKYPGIAKIIMTTLELFKKEFTGDHRELFKTICDQLIEEKIPLLHVASETESSEVISFLITDMKLDPVSLNHQQQTPLHLAKDSKTKQLLLEKMFDKIITSPDEKFLKSVTHDGENWLHYLAKLNYLAGFSGKIHQSARKLLSQGVSPYHRCQAGNTPFHYLQQVDDYKLSAIFRQEILFSKYVGVTPQIDKMKKFFSGILQNPSQSHFMLLSGPSGVGKTELIESLAADQKFQLIPFITGDPEDKWLGQLNKRVTEFFDNAVSLNKPVCLFMDEMDAITPEYPGSPSASSHDPNQMVNLIQTKITELQTKKTKVVLLGATNYLSKIKPAIKSRAGTNVVHFTLPDRPVRRLIIDDFLRFCKLENPKILDIVAESTTGWSPRLLMIYMQDFVKTPHATLTDDMFIRSFEPIRQSFMEEIKKEHKGAEINPPTLKVATRDLCDNLVALDPEVKRTLINVDAYLTNPEPYIRKGVQPENILLYGPPGTGKTVFAKAVADHSNALFIALSGGIFISFGAEMRLQMIFELAKGFEKAVIFIDECDNITTEYSSAREILQTEMDGFSKSKNILIVIGATNYLAKIAEPVLSRFTQVKVPLPDQKQRIELFKFFLSDPKKRDVYDDYVRSHLAEVALALSKQSRFFSPRDIKKMIENMVRNAITTGESISFQQLQLTLTKKADTLHPSVKIGSNMQNFVQNLPSTGVSSQSIRGETQTQSQSACDQPPRL